ncbi:hypothetical protein RS030_142234 [Cryptosporidium xiaoi]|uniref:Serine aminopeptidase S33 domain-containing protein n=1 Tax=Cryptosporidium xiaoi TaxID=659607 RepID=A0AAV9Y3K9_9CRYT
MEDFIKEYSVAPNQYCREKEFSTTGFKSRKTNIKHHYHLFRTDHSKERKGTAVLVHGYSSHTLGEYLNIVENKEFNYIHNNYYYYYNDKNIIENPLLKSKYITTYTGSYIEYFNSNGYDVISLDLEGHGFSKGKKCNTDNLDNNCYNIIQMLEVEISKYKPNKRDYLNKYNISVYNWNCKVNGGGKILNGNKQYSVESDEKENSYGVTNMFKYKYVNNQLINRKKTACIHCDSNECVFKNVFGDKLVICGISMGGATALRLVELIGQIIKEDKQEYLQLIKCIKSRIICTILLSPMLSLESIKKKPLNRFLLMFLSITSYLFPDLQVGERIKNPSCDYLSLFSKNDPLYYSKRAKALMCKSLFSFMDIIRKDISFYPADIPLLICHCVHDSLTDFDGSKQTIELLNKEFSDINSNVDPEFTLWPITSKKMWHVLTREVGFQDLLLRILDWVSKKEIQHDKKCKKINKIEKTSPKNQQIFISFKKKLFF